MVGSPVRLSGQLFMHGNVGGRSVFAVRSAGVKWRPLVEEDGSMSGGFRFWQRLANSDRLAPTEVLPARLHDTRMTRGVTQGC